MASPERRPRDSSDISAYCAALIAPGIRCDHRVEQHVFHGSALLECWRCEDWHHFQPQRPSDGWRDKPNAA